MAEDVLGRYPPLPYSLHRNRRWMSQRLVIGIRNKYHNYSDPAVAAAWLEAV